MERKGKGEMFSSGNILHARCSKGHELFIPSNTDKCYRTFKTFKGLNRLRVWFSGSKTVKRFKPLKRFKRFYIPTERRKAAIALLTFEFLSLEFPM